MQTTVVGSGTLTFYWRCDSETDYDYLTFMVDGEVWSWLTGDTGWNLSTYDFGAGEHVLCWNYWKDGSNSEGMDVGWVDQVAWTPSKTITPVPVPYTWLDQYPVLLALAGGDYEAAALADVDGDGHMAWQEYVAGSNPTNYLSVFRAVLTISNNTPWITWSPDLGTARVYSLWGKTNLTDAAWGPTNAASRFFRVSVGMP